MQDVNIYLVITNKMCILISALRSNILLNIDKRKKHITLFILFYIIFKVLTHILKVIYFFFLFSKTKHHILST